MALRSDGRSDLDTDSKQRRPNRSGHHERYAFERHYDFSPRTNWSSIAHKSTLDEKQREHSCWKSVAFSKCTTTSRTNLGGKSYTCFGTNSQAKGKTLA